FACSLFEALYGERPFQGDEPRDVVEPSGVRVPRAIRVAVRRALAVDPAARFADMDALIAALSVPRARASRITKAAIGALVAATAVAIALAIRSSDRDAACEALDVPMQATWNPTKSLQLRERMVAAGQAAPTIDRILATLDAHAAQWTARRTQTCTQT